MFWSFRSVACLLYRELRCLLAAIRLVLRAEHRCTAWHWVGSQVFQTEPKPKHPRIVPWFGEPTYRISFNETKNRCSSRVLPWIQDQQIFSWWKKLRTMYGREDRSPYCLVQPRWTCIWHPCWMNQPIDRNRGSHCRSRDRKINYRKKILHQERSTSRWRYSGSFVTLFR